MLQHYSCVLEHYNSVITTLQFCYYNTTIVCYNTTILLLQHYSSVITTLQLCYYNTIFVCYSSVATTLQFCCHNTTVTPRPLYVPKHYTPLRPSLSPQSKSAFIKSKLLILYYRHARSYNSDEMWRSASSHLSVCLSVCPHGRTSAPTGRTFL